MGTSKNHLRTMIVLAMLTQLCLASFPTKELQEHIDQRVELDLNESIVIGLIDGTGATFLTAGKSEVDEHTLFEMGSPAKVLTAATLSILAEQGKLSWADPLKEHYASTPNNPFDQAITLHHLACHIASLPREPNNLPEDKALHPYANYSADDLNNYLSSYVLKLPPSSGFLYSNTGYALLGAVIENTVGLPYAQAIDEVMLAPLGLKDTTVQPDKEQQGRLATGHAGLEPTPPSQMGVFAGAGAHLTTAADMTDMLAFMMGLKKSPYTKAFVSMEKAFVPSPFKDTEVTHGWLRTKLGAMDAILWHNGGSAGYASFIAYNPIRRKGVIVLTNTASQIEEIGFYALAPDTYSLTKWPKPYRLSEELLAELQGTYQVGPDLVAQLSVEDGRVSMKLTGKPKMRIYPRSKKSFHFGTVPGGLDLEITKTGKVKAILLRQGGARYRALRVEP